MALNATVTADAFEALADPIKEHYVKDGDSYKLETDIVPEDVAGLKTALATERHNAKEAKKDLKAVVDKYKDIDPEKARAAQTKIQEIEDQALADAGEFETLKTRTAQEKEDAISGVKAEYGTKLSKAETKLKQVLIDNEIIAEAVKQGVFPKATGTFAKLAREYVDLDAADDDFVPVIAAGKGTTIAELVQNLKDTDEFGIFFEADVATGSGSSQQNRSGGGRPNLKRSTMNTVEKSKYISDHGLKKYHELSE